MNKPIGLAAFVGKGSAARQDQTQGVPIRRRGRGKKDVVALTVRLPKAEWERLHQLAVAEGVSIQSLAVEGLSSVFLEKGLPKLAC